MGVEREEMVVVVVGFVVDVMRRMERWAGQILLYIRGRLEVLVV